MIDQMVRQSVLNVKKKYYEIYIPTYYVCNTIIALGKILDFPRGDKASRDSSFAGIPGDTLS